jgi:EmrB/QacA subfamily drug resistance transporter
MEKSENMIHENRWLLLFIIVLQPFMATLDSSIVNVALPVMAKRLSVNMASIEWVVTSYLIIVSATILIFGRLGDIIGKTLIFQWGIVIFTIGSLLCGISTSLSFLVISRIIQGVGAACTMANSQGIITHIFPQQERGKALGISGTFVALGTMVGPPLGGLIVSAFSWHYIFLINVPVGIAAFIMGARMLPKKESASEEKLDLRGAAMFSLSIILLFSGLLKGHQTGYTNPIIIMAFIGSILFFSAFMWWESRIEEPLLELGMFKNKLFSISIFCGFISFTSISCTNLIQPFYLQDVIKLSPAATGLFMMIYPLILSVVAPASGSLSDKIGSELLTFIGLILTASGLLLMSMLNENSNLLQMALFVAVLAVGNGLFQSPNNSLVMSTVPKTKLGVAGSINALVRNLGLIFGVSLSTTLLYNRMSELAGYRVVSYIPGKEDIFIYGMRIVYITAAIICAVGALTTAIRLFGKHKLRNTD